MDLQIGVTTIGFRALVLKIRCYLSFVFSVSCVFPPLFVCSVTFLINFILLFYLPLFYFFESIFLFWTISSIDIFLSFFFYKYSIKIFAKKGKKEVKKKKETQFSDLEAKFYYNLDLNFSNHIFAFKFELCAKIKNKKEEKCRKKKEKKSALRVFLVFTYLYFF